MTESFNITGLKNIYWEAIEKEEYSLVFQVKEGRGIFTFFMFISDEDEESNDRIFIHLKNIDFLLKLKLYGSHRKGDFNLFLNDFVKNKIVSELNLGSNGKSFNFNHFMNNLNNNIPKKLQIKTKSKLLRDNWNAIKRYSKEIVDDADKTILRGIKRLPEGHNPRDKTLRKLLLFTDWETQLVLEFIENLKKSKTTVCWTNDITKKHRSYADMVSLI